MSNELVLALDLSTKTGYAVLAKTRTAYAVLKYGNLYADENTSEYPMSYLLKAGSLACKVASVVEKFSPDTIVIEETNGSKSRYTQKLLEFIHFAVLSKVLVDGASVKYINTSDWRRQLDIGMSKDDKKTNAKLSKAKSSAAKAKKKLDKKKLGIAGRITKKHLALRYIKKELDIDFKMKDNDIAEAICIGIAYIKGAPTNGK